MISFKRVVVFLGCFSLAFGFTSNSAIAQKKKKMPKPPEEKKERFFIAVEEMPKLKGGLKELQKKVRYPKKARVKGIQGKVIVQFIVNENGKVENPEIVRGIGSSCDKEALRVIKKAEFIPGKQRGKAVRVQHSLPVMFVLKGKK